MFLTQRVHPFPFRTRKLSSAVAKILVWRRAGKIAQCRHSIPRSARSVLENGKLVILTQRVHPFPFRTRKLSSAVAKILVWGRTGKIAHCQHKKQPLRVDGGLWFFRNPFNNFTRKSVIIPLLRSLYSSLASCRTPTELSRNIHFIHIPP